MLFIPVFEIYFLSTYFWYYVYAITIGRSIKVLSISLPYIESFLSIPQPFIFTLTLDTINVLFDTKSPFFVLLDTKSCLTGKGPFTVSWSRLALAHTLTNKRASFFARHWWKFAPRTYNRWKFAPKKSKMLPRHFRAYRSLLFRHFFSSKPTFPNHNFTNL